MVDDIAKAFENALRTEAIIINQLDILQHLLEEMTEVTVNSIHWLIHYCDEHKIPFCNEQQLISYIKVSRQLNREFDNRTSDLKNFIESRKLPLNLQDLLESDEKKHLDDSDEEVTEPIVSIYKGGIVFSTH